jgi:hypothetical protein
MRLQRLVAARRLARWFTVRILGTLSEPAKGEAPVAEDVDQFAAARFEERLRAGCRKQWIGPIGTITSPSTRIPAFFRDCFAGDLHTGDF